MGDLRNADLSDGAWVRARDESEAREIEGAVDRFLETAPMMARWVRGMVADRDKTDGDAVIGWLATGGLKRNPEAAVIAWGEYERFLVGLTPVRAGEVVDMLLRFYARLAAVFTERGIQL